MTACRNLKKQSHGCALIKASAAAAAACCSDPLCSTCSKPTKPKLQKKLWLRQHSLPIWDHLGLLP